MKRKIKRISIVCQTGVETYKVGQKSIHKIQIEDVGYMGDPLEMYVCSSIDGFNIAVISPLAPIVIDYE